MKPDPSTQPMESYFPSYVYICHIHKHVYLCVSEMVKCYIILIAHQQNKLREPFLIWLWQGLTMRPS